MQTEQAQEILERVYDKMTAVSRFRRDSGKYHKMEIAKEEERRSVEHNPRRELLSALRQLPSALLEEPEDDHYTVLLGSGSGKSDPAVLEIWLSESELRIAAWAKEGLFHAGAARGAIDQVLRAMNAVQKGQAQ